MNVGEFWIDCVGVRELLDLCRVDREKRLRVRWSDYTVVRLNAHRRDYCRFCHIDRTGGGTASAAAGLQLRQERLQIDIVKSAVAIDVADGQQIGGR